MLCVYVNEEHVFHVRYLINVSLHWILFPSLEILILIGTDWNHFKSLNKNKNYR